MMDVDSPSIIPAVLSHPQSSGLNERMGHLRTMQLHHAETQDRLSWCGC